jgi:hypothetical protein
VNDVRPAGRQVQKTIRAGKAHVLETAPPVEKPAGLGNQLQSVSSAARRAPALFHERGSPMNRATEAVPASALSIVRDGHYPSICRFVGLKLAHRQMCLVTRGAILLVQIPGNGFGAAPALPGADLQN